MLKKVKKKDQELYRTQDVMDEITHSAGKRDAVHTPYLNGGLRSLTSFEIATTFALKQLMEIQQLPAQALLFRLTGLTARQTDKSTIHSFITSLTSNPDYPIYTPWLPQAHPNSQTIPFTHLIISPHAICHAMLQHCLQISSPLPAAP